MLASVLTGSMNQLPAQRIDGDSIAVATWTEAYGGSTSAYMTRWCWGIPAPAGLRRVMLLAHCIVTTLRRRPRQPARRWRTNRDGRRPAQGDGGNDRAADCPAA